MYNYEKISESCKELKLYKIYESNEIVRHIIERTDVKKDSIRPKDYCYNVTNKGADGKRYITWPRLFEYIGSSSYRFLGEGYPYSGSVIYSKDNEIYGYWTDGVFKEA